MTTTKGKAPDAKNRDGHSRWSARAMLRMAWAVLSSLVVESVVFGLAAMPAVALFRWHLTWSIDSAMLKTIVLAMALVPSYAVFMFLLMMLSAGSMKLLRWRPVAPADMPIAELGWPLCNWARYQISAHLVAFFAGELLRSTPVWSWYMRLNGARLGRRVWVNSLGVTDHCLLDFGDDVVIGAGVALSGHTVERGVVRLAPVRVGPGSTIGVNTHVGIGADIGRHCQIGSLSMVPKFRVLPDGGTYVGVPVQPIDRRPTTDQTGVNGDEE